MKIKMSHCNVKKQQQQQNMASLQWQTPIKIGSHICPNRLLKSALTEGLASPENRVTNRHIRLYEKWGQAGIGLIISGNIVCDRRYLERAGNVAIDLEYPHTYDGLQREMLRKWAKVSKAGGSIFIGQVSNAGLKVNQYTVDLTVGPNAGPAGVIPKGSTRKRSGLEMPAEARACTVDDFDLFVKKWVHTAKVLNECGWDGMQVHAAHGYLVCSLLSPTTNKRTDMYGGSLENRARLLLRILRGIRNVVLPNFIVSVKIHCSDLDDNGFKWKECAEVLSWLDQENLVDLVEFSGDFGRAMRASRGVVVGDNAPEGTFVPESLKTTWFADRVRAIRLTKKAGKVKLCVTGGYVHGYQLEDTIKTDLADMVGIGRPACIAIDDVGHRFKEDTEESTKIWRDAPQNFSNQMWLYHNFLNIGNGLGYDYEISIDKASEIHGQYHLDWALEYRKTMIDNGSGIGFVSSKL